jgi:hypothetical protein
MTSELINPDITFENDSDNALVIKNQQQIPQSFLDRLKTSRDATEGNRMGDFHRVASIPTVVVEKWMREGFNIWDKNVKASEIVTKLKAEHLDAFLTTTKRI